MSQHTIGKNSKKTYDNDTFYDIVYDIVRRTYDIVRLTYDRIRHRTYDIVYDMQYDIT